MFLASAIRTRKLPRSHGFTLVEMLTAIAVLSLIMLMLVSMIQLTGKAWSSAKGRVESFQGARAAFESMTHQIGEATLKTYYGYDSPTSPQNYVRTSELHFISGPSLYTATAGSTTLTDQVSHAVFFQAPAGYSATAAYAGLDNLLCACGYFIDYNIDIGRPSFIDALNNPPPKLYRYRLMQFYQPSEQLAVYQDTTTTKWFTVPLISSSPPLRQIAANIVALVINPKGIDPNGDYVPLTTNYSYNSRDTGSPKTLHVLPPVVEVVMVAIDEPSALKFRNPSTPVSFGVSPKGTGSGLFTDPAKLEADLDTLSDNLSAKSGNAAGNKIQTNFRIFRTEVPIRSARWSAYSSANGS